MFLLAFVFLLQDLPRCESVNTELGVVTCHHCSMTGKDGVSFPKLDTDIFAIDTVRFCHRVSGAKPSYFYDRRGTRHRLKAFGKNELYWKTDLTFFSGESGTGVFDSDDKCCGIVLGNVREQGRWLGRVSRFDVLIESIDRVPAGLVDRWDLRQIPQPALRSTPDSEEIEQASQSQNVEPHATEPQVHHGTFYTSE